MGHDTGIRVHTVFPELSQVDQSETGFLHAVTLFEFMFRNRYIQLQLDGRMIHKSLFPLTIYRQPPPNVKGFSMHNNGGPWQWGWCYPSELKALWQEGPDDWMHGLLRVASTLDDACHLIEIY